MSGNQHELFMMALTAVLSIIVSFFAGRIWEAWRAITINDADPELSREEIALIVADQLRREREQSARRKPVLAVGGGALGQPRRRAASNR
jgi:hypothetical protein